MFTRRLAILMLAGAAGCVAAPQTDGAATSRLIVLRHADRDVTGSDLNAMGRARAAALPAALADLPIDAIYSPDMARNIDTVAPFARARGLTIRLLETATINEGRIAATIRAAAPGSSWLWVGNSGNLRTLWEELGLELSNAPLSYGAITIVNLRDGQVVSTETRSWGP